MTITVENYLTNIIQSLYYWLNNITYTKNSVTKTLRGHFNEPQLDIVLGYPPALKELELPTIALVSEPIDEKKADVYAEQYSEIIYRFSIFGFCGGEQSFEANQKQRDLLCNDLRSILEEIDYIDIYSISNTPIASDFVTPITDVLIQRVRSRNINPAGILVAERYKFAIDFECLYLR